MSLCPALARAKVLLVVIQEVTLARHRNAAPPTPVAVLDVSP